MAVLIDSNTGELIDVGRIFSSWANSGFFQGRPTLVKFHFTNLKLREKHFSTKILIGKYQTSKSRGGLALPF